MHFGSRSRPPARTNSSTLTPTSSSSSSLSSPPRVSAGASSSSLQEPHSPSSSSAWSSAKDKQRRRRRGCCPTTWPLRAACCAPLAFIIVALYFVIVTYDMPAVLSSHTTSLPSFTLSGSRRAPPSSSPRLTAPLPPQRDTGGDTTTTLSNVERLKTYLPSLFSSAESSPTGGGGPLPRGATSPPPVDTEDDLSTQQQQQQHRPHKVTATEVAMRGALSKLAYRPSRAERALTQAPLYVAGVPRFPRVFARDSLVSALLLLDACDLALKQNVQQKTASLKRHSMEWRKAVEHLREVLQFAAKHQGRVANAESGEEPGKIFHETPGMPLNLGHDAVKHTTEYAACDTTALFLLGISRLYAALPAEQAMKTIQGFRLAIWNALGYVSRHVDDAGLFVDAPAFAGAQHFALRVTYWKDSALWDRPPTFEPQYPVTYTLVQAMYLEAVRSLCDMPDIVWGTSAPLDVAQQWQPHEIPLRQHWCDHTVFTMRSALRSLFVQGSFVTGTDQKGVLAGLSSDTLHILYFLRKDDLTEEQLQQLAQVGRQMETDQGYRSLTLTSQQRDSLKGRKFDSYHDDVVWIFEQALIHAGATRHGLPSIAHVAHRIKKVLDAAAAEGKFPEFTRAGKLAGNPVQLWTAAAALYFDRTSHEAAPVTAPVHKLHADEQQRLVQPQPAESHAHETPFRTVRAYCDETTSMLRGLDPVLEDRYCAETNAHTPVSPSRRFVGRAQLSGFSFTCLDGSLSVPIERVNDGWCDCADSSDEPGTNACAGKPRPSVFDTAAEPQSSGAKILNRIRGRQLPASKADSWKFHCRDSARTTVFHSMVNDGVCDCPNGSDEFDGFAQCGQ